MRTLLRDLRFGARGLAKAPVFALSTIGILALGIGANSAIFTLLNALLLQPFPYPRPNQLVSITSKDNVKENGGTLLRYELLRDENRSFQSVAVWTNDDLNLAGEGDPIQMSVARVSPSFFSTLGIRPYLGRLFTEEEGIPSGRYVVVLGNAIWRSRYHSDPEIVGKAIKLDSVESTVVGVLPEGARFPFMPDAQIFSPRYFEFSLMSPQRLRMGVGYLNTIARLREGITLSEGNEELALLNRRYSLENPTAPDTSPTTVMSARYLQDEAVGDLRLKMMILMAAVAVVLLIACANVASLLLSRALGRQREMATRAALGASRSGIARQLLTESILLSAIAGIFGVAIAVGATRGFELLGAAEIPRGFTVTVDWRVVIFTLTISIASGIIFGMFPAMKLAHTDLNTSLRDGARGSSLGHSRVQMNGLLVIGQVACSLVLLIAAALLVRSFRQLLKVDPGFEPRHLLTMNVSLSTTKYGKGEQQVAFFNDLLERLSQRVGIRSAAISAALPLSSKRITPVLPEGQPEVSLADRPFVDIEAISSQWFRTMSVPIRSGRTFVDGDNSAAPAVVIVNETFARQYWPKQDAIGKKITIGRKPVPALVVGVSGNVRNQGLEKDAQAQIYVPFPQLPWSDMNLLVRTDSSAEEAVRTVRSEISAIDPEQPLSNVEQAVELIDDARAQPRSMLLLLAAFSAAASLIATVGVYGALSYSVEQRRQEFGIRIALGASRSDILNMVMRQGMLLVALGLAAGICAAFIVMKLLTALLYQTNSHDIVAFIAGPALFLIVAGVATYVPARGATKVDPIETLR
ncbi:ABC transporter permease [Occallatibacter savannae]|uniref:ABC transporter permease n=1 Tax=Occallatibacter savannae TaxID=1002691 RepID=UPI000D69AF49|nr:ABC transporter permease [Occallatibacter savannae]